MSDEFDFSFDVSAVDPTPKMNAPRPQKAVIPPGIYKVICTELDFEPPKQNKDGHTFQGAKICMHVIEGAYRGEDIRDYMMLRHTGYDWMQEMGQRMLKQWTIAVGAPPSITPATKHLLMGKPMLIKVDVQKGKTVGDRNYPDKNRVREIKYTETPQPAAAPQQQMMHVTEPAPQPEPPAASGNQPVWMRG